MRWWSLVLLVGCSGGPVDTHVDTGLPGIDTEGEDTEPPGEDTEGGDTEGIDTGDIDTGEAGPTQDESMVRGLIEGTATVEQVMVGVGWSSGFPVATSSGTYLFVYPVDSGEWAIHGDFTDWAGTDQPVMMTQGSGFFWAEIPITSPAGQRYKIQNVDNAQDFADPWARSYEYDAYGEISFVRPPGDRFRFDRWPNLQGQGLEARDVRVLVPAGEGPWPVLYMHDGQNIFDPNAFYGGWDVQGTLAALGEDVLVVGIDNTGNRMREYTHTPDTFGVTVSNPLGQEYAALIQEDLRPVMEAVYGSNGVDGVLGSSLGGLISLYIADLYPDEFDFVGSMSGTVGWGRFEENGPMVQELYTAAGVRDFVIYVDSGGDDGDDGCTDPNDDGFVVDDPNYSDHFCTNRQFADTMADMGYTWDENIFHYHEPGAPHNEGSWKARLDIPLSIFTSINP